MLQIGLKYAFEILGVDVVTIGVFENNEIAHNCYKKVGFIDKEIVIKIPWNVIEMEISKEDWIKDSLAGLVLLPLSEPHKKSGRVDTKNYQKSNATVLQ